MTDAPEADLEPDLEPDVEQLAAALPGVLGPMFRLLRRAVAADYPRPRLPDAQVDLLRLVERRPGVAVTDAAAALHVAPNTVSTLVGQLVDAGLVARRRGLSDRRTHALHLTPQARDRLVEWGEHRQRVLTELLGTLDRDDRAALHAALPALAALRDALAARATTAGGS